MTLQPERLLSMQHKNAFDKLLNVGAKQRLYCHKARIRSFYSLAKIIINLPQTVTSGNIWMIESE